MSRPPENPVASVLLVKKLSTTRVVAQHCHSHLQVWPSSRRLSRRHSSKHQRSSLPPRVLYRQDLAWTRLDPPHRLILRSLLRHCNQPQVQQLLRLLPTARSQCHRSKDWATCSHISRHRCRHRLRRDTVPSTRLHHLLRVTLNSTATMGTCLARCRHHCHLLINSRVRPCSSTSSSSSKASRTSHPRTTEPPIRASTSPRSRCSSTRDLQHQASATRTLAQASSLTRADRHCLPVSQAASFRPWVLLLHPCSRLVHHHSRPSA